MGKEEVWERNWLILKLVYRLIESAQRNRKYRGRVSCRDRKRIGCRKVPSIYQHAHRDV
jgi:hypothetical protein